MGKASRRNRTRTPRAAPADTSAHGAWQPGPTSGHDVDGVPLPPGCPGSLFDVYKIDPRPGVNGGAYQFFVLPNEPYGKMLSTCLANQDWDLYAFAARTALGDVFRAKAGPFVSKMEDGFRRNALNYLLVLRLIPLFPFWLVNLVPAFLGVSTATYVLGTFVGIIPGTFVYASVGNGLGALIDAGQDPDLRIIFRLDILGPLLGLAALALLPVVYKRMRARRETA